MRKENWTYKKLGEVCDVINGLWTGKKEPFVNVAVIRNTNFSKDCKLKLDDVAYIDVEAKQFASRKLQCGDIIIEKSGGSEKQPVGRPVLFDIVEGDYSFSNFTSTLRIKEGERISPKFLHICLYSYYVQGVTLKMQSKTTGLHNLDMKAFLQLQIPKLSHETQSRIVSELDLLQSIIDKQKTQLKELDNLAQAIFYDMFGDPVENEKGWDCVPFNTVCKGMTKGPFGSDIKKSLFVPKSNDTIKVYIQINAIQKNENLGDYYITKEYFERKMTRFEVFPQDYIITCDGTLGKCLRLSESMERGIISASLLKLTLNEIIIPYYFESLWENYLLSKLVNQARNAALIHLPSAKVIGNELIPLPPLSLQQAFAEKIESIERQKELINQSIREAQTLFDSRMEYYFGE